MVKNFFVLMLIFGSLLILYFMCLFVKGLSFGGGDILLPIIYLGKYPIEDISLNFFSESSILNVFFWSIIFFGGYKLLRNFISKTKRKI